MEQSRLASFRTAPTQYRGAIALFVVMLASAVVCNAATPTISQEDLLKKIEAGEAPLILDVRTPKEYRSGHVPQAINIPHQELVRRVAELADTRDREVVTYCENGVRARLAEYVLQQAGFSAVRHLAGDMYAWRRSGLPIERP